MFFRLRFVMHLIWELRALFRCLIGSMLLLFMVCNLVVNYGG